MQQVKSVRSKGLYIHLPFCSSKCWYCDFYSRPYGRSEAGAYVAALERERDIRFSQFPWGDGASVPVWDTAYIGGGTPSVLPFDLLERVLRIPRVITGGEYTIEANPEQVSRDWLLRIMDAGVNRVSMGVQSFDSALLDAVGRQHQPGRAVQAIEALALSGINFSLDLIYGLPGQTVDGWHDALRRMFEIRPPHFSAYLLSYEPGTRLYARLMAGKTVEASEEMAEEMYHILCSEAACTGYHHYEVSNFALPGSEAKHNSSYWDGTPYIGLGCSAHSFDGINRAANPASVSQYVRDLSLGKLPLEVEESTPLDRLNDDIITSLRTSRGFLLPVDAPSALSEVVRRHLQAGTLVAVPGGRVAIPEALWLRSDAVMRDLIQV
ncbi:MAG: radical SAM family heme chaperone HemW [Muribaculaceae bacterium]|nr:radical SAM family heme chaperone HemW [Muribaculaceae bacterium]